jgi:isovaleryl-CoA dehydrogenase
MFVRGGVERVGGRTLGAGAAWARRLASQGAWVDRFTPTEEHGALRRMVREFASSEVEAQALEYNRAERLNVGLLRKCGELGLLGITAPTEFGGSGMDAVAAAIVHEELSAADPAFTLAYLAHSMLFVNNLAVNGSAEQKAQYLPGACSGALIGGMCMTEPGAGTDVLGMKTVGAKDADGSFRLSGEKMWITNGAVSDTELGDIFLVYARTHGKPGSKPGRKDYSLFLVEKGFPGFSLGQRIKDKCGMRASTTAELVFDNVRVPAKNIVGHEGMLWGGGGSVGCGVWGVGSGVVDKQCHQGPARSGCSALIP